MRQVFHTVFGRWPDGREIKVLNRLTRLYGTKITESAVKLACIVTNGSPINYINKVAHELAEEQSFSYDALREDTRKALEDLRKYESSI